MKKILLFLSFLLMNIGVWGATTSFTSNSDVNSTKTITKNGITLTLSSNCPALNAYAEYRIYASNSFTISSTLTITKIIVTTNTAKGNATKLVTSGYSAIGTTGTWTGSSTSIKFNASEQVRVLKIDVTYEGTSPTIYTVTYNANGGAVSPSSWSQISSGQSTTLPTPTRDEYTFNGWYTASSSGTKVGNAGASFTPTSDTTLYAQWTKNEPEPEECTIFHETFGDNPNSVRDWDDTYSVKSGVLSVYNDISYTISNAGQSKNNTGSDLSGLLQRTKGTNAYIIIGPLNVENYNNLVLTYQWKAASINGTYSTNLYYATSLSSSYTEVSGTGTGATAFIECEYNLPSAAQVSTLYLKIVWNTSNAQGIIDEINLCGEENNCSKTVLVTKGSEINGTFTLDKSEVCADNGGGNVNVTYEPADGYEFDSISTTVGNVSGNLVTNITDNTTITVHFKEILVPNIDIVEWNPDYIKIDIENFDGAVTALIENKNTQEAHQDNLADSLFFSKYFEAAGNVKLIALYNGTNHNIDISEYSFSKSQNGEEFKDTKFKNFKLSNGDNLTSDDLLLESGEEIIFISYSENDQYDTLYIKCAKNNPHSGFDTYHKISTPNLDFNGDDAVGLKNQDGNFIDLIGAPNKLGVVTKTGRQFMDDNGWYTEDGININTNDSNYALSTNRCLLIRKNSVKSGLNAVNKNDTNFVTLGGIYGEWKGLQIPGTTPEEKEANTCAGFDDVGSYDYNAYYATYAQVGDTIRLDTVYREDGSYQLSIPHLDTLSCTYLKVIVCDTTNKEKEYKIPIFVTNSVNSNNELFTQEGDDCPECDVVVLNGGTLTIVPDSLENRNVTVYPGGRLIVPSETKYKINSLTLRRDNNELPHLLYNGTLDIKDKNGFIFELRTDGQDWRWMTLPFAFNPKNVKQSNGKLITDILNDKVWVSYYDGKYRAYNRYNGWKDVAGDGVADTTFNAGAGFLFGISGNKVKKTYKFIWSPDSLAHEKADKTIGNLYAWGGKNESITENNKGWNLIGNPFMDNDTTDFIDPIRKDSLVKVYDTNGNWTGGWKLSGTERGSKLRYAVLPVFDERRWTDPDIIAAGGYESVVLDDYVLKPFTSFFVQLGGNESTNQAVTFKPITSILPNRIVARQQTFDEDEELFLRVKVGDRKTGMFISNKFTDKYEPGDDLESRYQIYQSIGGYKLLYSAINDSIIEHGVQITSPQGTLYLDPKVNVNKFEYIYANYNNNWYDLKSETVEVNGNFIIQAKRKVKDIPTDIEMLMKINNIEKFIYNNNMYIKKHDHIYNVLGNQVR